MSESKKLRNARFISGDAEEKLQEISAESVQTIITSPPYFGLRDYGVDGQIGLENRIEQYVSNLCDVFDEAWNVLSEDGTLWLNLGDKYARKKSGGTKPKDLIGVPWEVAFELRSRGWYLRSDIIWQRPDPMPESADDRPTSSHEHIFLFSKNKDYYYDHEAIKEEAIHSDDRRHGEGRIGYNGKRQGQEGTGQEAFVSIKDRRNKRDVWTVTTAQLSGEAHFAPYPVDLIEPCVIAGSEEEDRVLDPFSGAGTTGIAALKHGRKYVGIDLNEEYNDLAKKRISNHEDVPVQHEFWD